MLFFTCPSLNRRPFPAFFYPLPMFLHFPFSLLISHPPLLILHPTNTNTQLHPPTYCTRPKHSSDSNLSIIKKIAQIPLIPLALAPPSATRLTPNFSRHYVNQDMTREFTGHAQFEMNLDNIYDHYAMFNVDYYDITALGFLQSAQLLAQQVPAGFQPTSILDLGTGTGDTLVEVCKAMTSRVPIRHIAMLDLIPRFLEQATEKLSEEMLLNNTVTPLLHQHQVLRLLRSHDEFDNIRAVFGNRPAPNLVTAQRVLVSVAIANQANVLRGWMSLTAPGGKLIVDVSHPDRFLALEWIGRPGREGLDIRPRHEYCFRIADETAWEECREHARRLAAAAGLEIEGDMVAQRPVEGVVDKCEALQDWISQRRPTSWAGSLSRVEMEWFRKDYMETVKPLYNTQGFSHQPEMSDRILAACYHFGNCLQHYHF